jgi:NADH:ubiquinone oxidoreductase subunit H
MELLYLLIELIVKCVVVFAGLMIVVAYLTWLERKVLGHIQVRMVLIGAVPTAYFQPFQML